MTPPGPTLDGRPPVVVAHRGSSAARPEHTLAAYELALAEGADVLECDVRLTADGHLVCHHDLRLERTSDGSGLLAEMTLEQLSELDFGSWAGRPTAGVLTFEALLDLLLAQERPVGLAVETKHPTRHGGAVEEVLAAALRERGLHAGAPGRPPVRIMSFSTPALRRAAALLPELPRTLLTGLGLRMHAVTGRMPGELDEAGVSTRLLRRAPGLVARHHRRGHRVLVFTADEPADVRRCLELGVDGIITNQPAPTRRMVESVWDSA